MADQWSQVKEFLKKAKEDIKKTGEDIANETGKLIEDLKDPANQQKVREKLQELGTWAKGAANDAASLAEVAIKKVEEGLSTASDFVSESIAKGGPNPSDSTEAPTPKAAKSERKTQKKARKTGPKAVKKTIGRKKKG